MSRLERWLDQGIGTCVLRLPAISRHVLDSIHSLNGSACEIGCCVIMPNHVHAVLRPLAPSSMNLEKILQHWKGSAARTINLELNQRGTLWQRESFDSIIRDQEHLYRVIQYIGRNPLKAGLPMGTYRLWISPDWVQIGWNYESG